MKKKFVLTMVATIILVGLLACGSNNSATSDNIETTNDSLTAENVSEDIAETASDSLTAENISEDITTGTGESEKILPIWYMDSEGIKSDILGIIIRKDNALLKDLCFLENVGVYTPNPSGNGGVLRQNVISCQYYEGTLDDYISEYSGMEKGKLGDFSYAYKQTDQDETDVVFVGNGVMLKASFSIENESIDDFLNRINLIRPYNESPVDCLAFITANGIYCPALGIRIACDDSKNAVNSISIRCKLNIDTGFSYIRLSDESIGRMYYMADAENAQEVVDQYVAGALEPNEYKTVEHTAIDGISEVTLGNCNFLGRGVIEDEEQEKWLFYSDDSTWSIEFRYDVGYKYQDFISIIEDLE